jgi:hypothetical protein
VDAHGDSYADRDTDVHAYTRTNRYARSTDACAASGLGGRSATAGATGASRCTDAH